MTTYLPPKKNVQLICYTGLVDANNRPQFRINPTLAAGDVVVVRDDTVLGNITTLPAAVTSGSTAGKVVKVTLSATEMNGDNIAVVFSDQTVPPEWDDLLIPIQTAANQFNDLPLANVRKNQALAKFQFLMTDSTNHAPATGKSVTCTRSIDGGAFAAGTLANVGEVANGTYVVDFLAADLNGNVIVLRATASGCDDTFVTLVTMA